jgi:hypothetical protein
MAITKEILDELLKGYQKPEDLLGQSGLLQQLSKALIERVLDGEMTHHLGYEKHSPEGRNSDNSRNGKSRKTLKGKQGEIPIEVPRDRNGEFDPQFVKKRQTRFDGFDDKIICVPSAEWVSLRWICLTCCFMRQDSSPKVRVQPSVYRLFFSICPSCWFVSLR